MHNRCWKSFLGLTLAASLLVAPAVSHGGGLEFRAPGISGDTSSDGAVITVALFTTVCAVLVILGLKADYENVFTRFDTHRAPMEIRDPDPEVVREITRRFDSAMASARDDSSADPMSVGVAWNVRF